MAHETTPQVIGTCHYSGKDILRGDDFFIIHHGHIVLTEYREEYAIDYFTRDIYPTDDMTLLYNGDYANEGNGSVVYCETDGDYYPESHHEIVEIEGYYFHVSDDNIIMHDGTWYTIDDFNERFIECTQCGNYINTTSEEYYYNEYGDPICENCRHDERRAIQCYSYKPEPIFFGGQPSKNKLFFGLEIEVEGDREYARNVKEISEIFYCKDDGSINGFEIVTHPLSYNWIMENKHIFKKLSSFLISKGFTGHNNGRCGIHIHVSKKSISILTITKLLLFFYNEPEFIRKISQRTMNSFESWSNIFYEKSKAPRIAKKTWCLDRNTAINTRPEDTIEFRAFRGNIRYDRIMKNIEFTKAIIDFCKISGITELNKDNFIKSLDRTNFPNLLEFLKEKNLIIQKNKIHKEYLQEV